MFKKGMGVAMCVVGILSLACVAGAGDLMQWYPRTPAGGASVVLLPSLLNQAAVVEYGPEAALNRDLTTESRSETELKNYSSSVSRTFEFDANGLSVLTGEAVYDQTSEQTQKSVSTRLSP